MHYYIDFDGTLISNSLEETLKNYQMKSELSWHNSSSLWDWYNEFISKNCNMPLNKNLLNQLIILKEQGHHLHIWTNRSYDLKKYTLSNLGNYKSLFTSFLFNDGMKINTKVDGIVVDNDAKYLTCGLQGGILI
jgi:uncharacterized HAD superfamily protein